VAVDLRWLDAEHPAEADLAAAAALLEGARAVDAPHQVPLTRRSFLAEVQHGWDGHPPRYALAVDETTDRALAVMAFELPYWDNQHLAQGHVTVEPRLRRRGIGAAVLDELTRLARKEDRSVLLVQTDDTEGGAALLAGAGFEPASHEAQRRLDVTAVDRVELARLRAAAEQAAHGYEVLRLPGRVPDELAAATAELTTAINDAPIDDLDIEDEVFPTERLRSFEAAQLASGRRVYRLVAREHATGELAGVTVLGVDSDRPWYGDQFDTSVPRAHRGHRLGMLLKASMLEWLAEAEPQLRSIDTWNAITNPYMVGINEQLGFRVVGLGTVWQLHL
jgi:GNAT superfamily N-acetyltransferase